jgi:phospholipase A1
MRYKQVLGQPSAWHSLKYLSVVVVGLAGLVPAGQVVADDMETCLAQMLMQSGDSTTVGEIRAHCAQQTQAIEPDEQGDEPAVVSDRLELDRKHVLQPFTLMAHKPNYFLAAAHNTKGYDPQLFQEQYRNPSIEFDKTEAQFQVSLKAPLWVGLFDKVDVYAAYTNRSFWQFYNSELSSPFRETDHEPEVWAQFSPSWKILGFSNLANSIGVVHQSNGQGGVLSRSWNRIYANFVFAKGNFAFGIKPWIRLSEDASNDDNPDIIDYMGHFEVRAGYEWNGNVFSVMTRNNLESGFDRGAFEFGWSFPLWKYPYFKGYIQYFRGYGESLIDYNHFVNRIGIGISLTDWL